MSNFHCEKCGAAVYDGPRGYVTGCDHYPADLGAGRKAEGRPADLPTRGTLRIRQAIQRLIQPLIERGFVDKEVLYQRLGEVLGRQFDIDEIHDLEEADLVIRVLVEDFNVEMRAAGSLI